MQFLKKYYIFIIEYIVGNILFNIVFSIIKSFTLINLGATKETLFNNLLMSFKETIIVYSIIYAVLVIDQIVYDRYIVNTLNNKIKKINERRNSKDE